MGLNLIELEQKGLAELNQGNYQKAIEYFLEIIEVNPNYEHGMCFYDIACAYEEIGEIEKAQIHFEKALSYIPDDPNRLGGYASFLFVHGDPTIAFEAYLQLFKLEQAQHLTEASKSTIEGIKILGEKIGISEEEIIQMTSRE